MSKKVLGIAVLVIGIGVALSLFLNWDRTDFAGSDLVHPVFAAGGGPPHGSAPTLGCWDCHGEHPPKTAPPASEMSCFDCHEVR